MHTSTHPAQPPLRRSRLSQISHNGYSCRAQSSGKAALPQPSGKWICQTLLADDNELFRSFLRNILARHFPFMLIAEAGDGDHALALDAELHPQLVFMDIKLPLRSGLDLTRQFKSANPGVLIYLVTQHDIPEYRTAARECGADQVIVMGESSEAAIVALVEATLFDHPRISGMGAGEVLCTTEECLPDLPG
jgi:CheY-like chemotaxis protein